MRIFNFQFSITELPKEAKVKKRMKSSSPSNSKRGFTFIDVMVGTALVLIIFMGIFGAYQLGMKVVGQSKNKITATAIANEQIEKIRNLPYESIGVKGSYPDGVLDSATTTILNGIEYKIERRVDFVVDPADGIASPDDDCPNDYKKVEIKVSWPGRFPGEVKLVSDFAPKNLAQECAIAGGILSVTVFDAYGKWEETRGAPLIEIKDPQTDQTLKSATPIEGKHYFSLATSTYKVVISKSDYSNERTYGIEEITTPLRPHPIVLEGQMTEISFSIDKISAFSVNTLSSWGTDSFSDFFDDISKISEFSNVTVSGGAVNLATTTEGYLSSGYLISTDISPATAILLNWDEFSFTDYEPADTDLKYQIYYASGTDWVLIPDSDLPGNSMGFDESPVSLSNLATTTHSKLKLRANFSTNSTFSTPILKDYQLSWITSEPTPIQNATFSLRGEKLIGYNANENPVYKYSTTTATDFSGHKDLLNLEWDNYTFSVDPETGLNLAGIDPEPQPIGLIPDTILQVNLYLESENSLLVTVQNIETLEPIFSAAVRLFNSGLGYDTTQYTNEKGQTFFIPLESATYNLEVEGPGYLATSTTVWVSGNTTKTVKITQVE